MATDHTDSRRRPGSPKSSLGRDATDGWTLIGGRQLGICRRITTKKGVSYSLGFDVAGDVVGGGGVTIYVDGVKLSVFDKSSPGWPHVTINFVGAGGTQTIQIVALTAGGAIDAKSPAGTSQSPKFTLTGMPVGSVLSDGAYNISVIASQQVVDISGWDAKKLAITPPPDFSGKVQLLGTASATIVSKSAKARVTREFTVEIEHKPNPYLIRGEKPRKPAEKNLVAGALKSADLSHAIKLPWIAPVKPTAKKDIEPDADKRLEEWLQKMEESVGKAFEAKLDKIRKKH
jgi:hypothetical protein